MVASKLPDSPAEPWDTEPDELDFEAYGLSCALRRGPRRTWCGYVGLPTTHPLHGVDWSDPSVPWEEFEVHGDVTWTDNYAGSDHTKTEGLWWVGFDCGHKNDLIPDMVTLEDYPLLPDVGTAWGTYRTMEYAKQECERLAKQLAEMIDAKK